MESSNGMEWNGIEWNGMNGMNQWIDDGLNELNKKYIINKYK